MFQFGMIRDSSAAAAYLSQGDYWLDDAQDKSIWKGIAAKIFGINGQQVTEQDLRSFLNNKDRSGDKIAMSRGGLKSRRHGYEMVFSAPKSLSVMAAMHDPRLYAAQEYAVNATMQLMQANASRQTRGTRGEIHTGNLMWASIPHRFTRPIDGHPDMQMHNHVIIPNLTFDKGRWYALEMKPIKNASQLYESFYHATLADQVQKLGYDIRKTKDAFEITGVPDRVLSEFSRRRQKIEETAKALYGDDITSQGKLYQSIAVVGRERKSKQLAEDQLKALWNARLSPYEQQQLERVYRNALARPYVSEIDNEKYFLAAFEKTTKNRYVVPEQKVLINALKDGIGKVTYEGLKAQANDTRFIRLKNGHISTYENLRKEWQYVDLARGWVHKMPKMGRDTYRVKPPKLKHGQWKAINKLLDSRSRFASLRAAVHTFKPDMVQAIEDNTDLPVQVADASKIVQVIPEENSLLIIDNAHKLTSPEISRVVELADQLDARVVFMSPKRKDDRSEPLQALEDNGMVVADIIQEMYYPVLDEQLPRLTERFKHYMNFILPERMRYELERTLHPKQPDYGYSAAKRAEYER